MPYDRDKAIAYAQTYWTIPCKDGLLGLEDGRPSVDHYRRTMHAPAPDWKALFVRDQAGNETAVFRKEGEDDKVFHGWDGLDDCAHYVSQCFKAGGAAIETQFGAQGLKNALQDRHQPTKTLIENSSQAAGQRIIDAGLLAEGDAVIYYKTVASEGSHVGNHHSAMYVGDNGITCHSTCRYKGLGDSSDDEWHLNAGAIYKYTFIHFAADDHFAADQVNRVTGWWKLDYGGRTDYCAVLSNGTARRSQTAPKKASDRPPATPSAYWFQGLSSIKFAWKESGDFEEWTIRTDDKTRASATLNDIAGSAVKLFLTQQK